VFFGAEAYDSDPSKLTDKDVIEELWKAGFDGAYEHPTYKILQGIYEEGKWANDLDGETFSGDRFHNCVRYLENHDEVRIANPRHWGGHGMGAGKPAAGVMYGMSRSAIMIYSGQEIGEPAIGGEGFSGDDGRTSIFDYTSMPEFQGWVNGGKYDGAGLSEERKDLRDWYAGLLHVLREPAFTQGDFYGLNHWNKNNPDFGRLEDEDVSGHWLFAFLRCDQEGGQAFLCVANFHPQAAMKSVKVKFPESAFSFIGKGPSEMISLVGRFGSDGELTASGSSVQSDGFDIGELPPFGVNYFELK